MVEIIQQVGPLRRAGASKLTELRPNTLEVSGL